MRHQHRIAIIVLSLAIVTGSCRTDRPTPAAGPGTPAPTTAGVTQPAAPSPPIDEAFWKAWGDGKGEVSGYELTQPRYGNLRSGTAVLIFVTETFADGPRVKSDPGRRPASQEFPVMKLNTVEDFSTGIYDYNLLTSSFVALAPVHGRPSGSATKVSFSSQEWCGHVYSQALLDSASIRLVLHSYFDGEADTTRRLDGSPSLAEDALFVWARGLAWPVVAPGDSLEVPLFGSLKRARLSHHPVENLAVTLAVAAKTTTVTVPGGTFEVRERTARVAGGRTWSFDVEESAPHRLLRWSASDGEEGSYLGGERLSYWEMNGPGFESELHRLGLTARPPRTP